jgi:hypothetical protein
MAGHIVDAASLKHEVLEQARASFRLPVEDDSDS